MMTIAEYLVGLFVGGFTTIIVFSVCLAYRQHRKYDVPFRIAFRVLIRLLFRIP